MSQAPYDIADLAHLEMRVLICICSGSVPNQIQTSPSLHACFFFPPLFLSHNRIRHGQVESWIQIIFPIFVEIHVSFVHLSWTECVFTTQVEFSNEQEGRSFLKHEKLSHCFISLFFWNFRIMGSSEQLCYRGVFGLEQCHCLCRNNLVCPASDQVSISKSGFQTASPPLFLFCFSLHVLRMRHFVSLLGTVTCGVHSVLFARGNVRGTIVTANQNKAVWNVRLTIRPPRRSSLRRLTSLRKFSFLTIDLCCGLTFPEASPLVQV